jgi:hypothetical protein
LLDSRSLTSIKPSTINSTGTTGTTKTTDTTGNGMVRAFPRVVDSRQRRMKRAPMHLAWMAPRSDIWHTKRNTETGMRVGKVMTNAERLANGMALLPPTKRSTGTSLNFPSSFFALLFLGISCSRITARQSRPVKGDNRLTM